MAFIETRRVAVDGITTSVLAGGTHTPGEAVVFVHGNPGAGSDWMPLMTHVAEFAAVVAPDLPGFGAADGRADWDYTVAGYATFLDGVINGLGLERVHLVAHDFGGPIAATWTADHPERVASVTMINTGVLIGYRWHRLARLWRTPVVGELVMRASTFSAVRGILRHDNPDLPMRWVETIARHLLPADTRSAVLKLYRSTRAADVEALAPRLHCHDIDALVVFGDADVYIPAEQSYRQVQSFPRAEVRVLPGVGHWCWLERPDRVAAHVVPFLRQRVGTLIGSNK